MDIFSSVKDLSQKTHNIDSNIQVKSKSIKEVEEISKNNIEKKSKEEIKKELQKVVEELNKAMNPLNQDLHFQFNNKVEELVVQVIDKKNDKIIREFPPKEALQLMEKMRELVGLLFDKKG